MSNKKQKEEAMSHSETRRNFLKKAAYSAPVLTTLGQLAKPTETRAESFTPNPWQG